MEDHSYSTFQYMINIVNDHLPEVETFVMNEVNKVTQHLWDQLSVDTHRILISSLNEYIREGNLQHFM